jgi:histidine triad (HIT) family protein
MSDCIFCKLVDGKIPSSKIYEDDHVVGFKDLKPEADIHQLFIHKKHTKDINEMVKDDPAQLAHLFNAIRLYTEKERLNESGFRVVTNLGRNAGQTVFHTHLHVLGGEPLGTFGS